MRKLEEACEEFVARVKGLRSGFSDEWIAAETRNEMTRYGRLKSRTCKRLSRWRHTGGLFAVGQDAAQQLSRAVYGRVIERED